MKRIVIVVVGLLLLFPAVSMAADEPSFEGGQDEVIASLNAPSFRATVNISVAADFRAANATMMVTGMASEGNSSAYPERIEAMLDGTPIWAFQQIGFGALGRQTRFSNDGQDAKFQFSSFGGTSKTAIRLPKNAQVQTSSMELSGFPSSGETGELISFNDTGGSFGCSVSCAGDVNGDGYVDLIIGAYEDSTDGERFGRAFIYYGGPDMDSTADIIFSGAGVSDALGRSVSGVGDVNNDGYDDVIVGANCMVHWNNEWGYANIYFGGPNMDNTPDVHLHGTMPNDYFGYSVSGAGDVNKDGYDDVVVGAYGNDSAGENAGSAYIYYGGAQMDNISELNLFGSAAGDDLGYSVSDAGDVNKDGYDDVMVGVTHNGGGGRAYIFYGRPSMNSTPDVVLTGALSSQSFGFSVSGAGDVNNDSYDDVIVGDKFDGAGGLHAGAAYLFYGGPSMDGSADVIFNGSPANELYGNAVSGAGDVNGDGFDDVIVGQHFNSTGGTGAGAAFVYFGGANMDTAPDMSVLGPSEYDWYGESVSCAGDLNKDGNDEVIIGGVNSGAHVYGLGKLYPGIRDPAVHVGSKNIWNVTGFFNGTDATDDFAVVVNDYLRSATASGIDSFGNSYVDVPVNISAYNGGNLTLFNLSIFYMSNATIQNFASALNSYLEAHQGQEDTAGNITVPIKILSSSAGRIKLFNPSLARKMPPALVREIGPAELLEDSWNSTVIDLYTYFQDGIDPDSNLDFSIVSSTNSNFVTVGIRNKRYVAADAFTGDANDNWTGTVEVVVACADHWGQATESNKFTITVKNVDDEPIITSTPVMSAEAKVPYHYTVTAIDGDNDRLQFSLSEAPPNMTIGAETGEITWIPCTRGNVNVTAVVSDGTVSVEQDFKILVPNKAPRITSTPPLNGMTGARYTYTVTAEDDNLDALTYSLTSKITGMQIGPTDWTITWTPEYANDYDVVVVVSDGNATAMQEFTINVTQGNRVPKFICIPIKTATVGVPYEYQAKATDEDGDKLTFSLVEPPAGMTIEAGKVSWKPMTAGNFTVKIKVVDGRGGEVVQEFVINVADKVRPGVAILRPSENEQVKGKTTLSGTAIKGTLEVVSVQVRVDGGDWTDANGNYSWQFVLDTTKLKNGKHQIEARAFDGTGYSDIVTRQFTVDNQKAQAKGFIPGFEMEILLLALVLTAFLSHGMERQNRRDLR